MDVYQKLNAEYQNAQKPLTYQYKNIPSTVRQKKFGVILDRVIKMLEKGIKEKYLQASEDDDYYWNYLVEVFKNYKNERLDFNKLTEERLKDKLAEDKWWEIYYVEDEMHLPVVEKVKEWIVLLLANHKLFEALEVIGEHLSVLFVDSNYMKSQEYNDLKKSIYFLADYEYRVTCDLIGDYEEYCSQRKQREFLEGLEEIKRIRHAWEREEEQRKFDLEKISNISRGLYQMIMKEVEIVQQRQREEEIKKEKNMKKEELLDQSVEEMQSYIGRRPTTYMESINDLSQSNVTPGFHTHEPHIKKSQKLYREEYEDLQKEFQFDLEPEETEDKTLCADCQAKLTAGLYLIGNNQNYCHYTGKWYCNDCIAPERTQIPWKALKNFDLRGYSVSKKSFYDIKAYYQKPIIEIPMDSAVIQKSRELFEFLVVKRQIHLMYDSICNIELIQKVLKKLNYCLKKNLFSLHNLYSVYMGSQLPALQQIYNMLEIHFNRCADCLRKGYICKICNKPDRIFTFQLRETKGCNQCKKLYHINCLRYKPCICSNK